MAVSNSILHARSPTSLGQFCSSKGEVQERLIKLTFPLLSKGSMSFFLKQNKTAYTSVLSINNFSWLFC